MKNSILKLLSFSLVAAFLLSACSRDNSVVSNSRIQKRKYTGGFHFESNKKVKSIKEGQEIEKEVFAIVEEDFPNTEVIVSEVAVKNENLTVDEVTFENSTIQSNSIVNKTKSTENNFGNEKLTSDSNEKGTTQNTKSAKKDLKQELKVLKKGVKNDLKSNSGGDEAILYIILCILIPFVAVGLATDWDITKVLIALLLSFLFWLPGIIYAFYICDQEGVI
jgi:uncharacterized membrane protein YqaE (UPF0057 family)/uncharacterized protein YqkB